MSGDNNDFSIDNVQIIRSNRWTFSLFVWKTGEVFLRCPPQATDEEILRFYNHNKASVEKQVARYKRQMTRYTKVIPEMVVLRNYTTEDIRRLADEALRVIPERVRHFAPIIGVTYGRITIRNQKSKWGSCSAKGNLNFNCLLMDAPADVLDYLVVHELCHRKQMNHSPAFWAEVARVLPDYQKQEQWLKTEGSKLIRRMTSGDNNDFSIDNVQIIRSNRWTFSLFVWKTGEVFLRCPPHATDEEILRFYNHNKASVEKQVARYKRQMTRYTKVIPEMVVLRNYTTEDIRHLADEALRVIPERVRHFAPIVGVTYGRITIRNQKSRWGSCSAKGNLNFNCLLMDAPADVLDYVMVHELCHRIHLDHSPAFWAEVARVLPDYQKQKQWLKTEGSKLIRRMMKP